ncbi:MAG: DUF1569 domain-containing protein [Planctomycetes bacterium]|nr:DUF1569 domain-containing protein [Planctomycetota bacterium]MCB9910981.1 DUF1569 domain-containing protein [Planctomycetota bacterium]
MSIPSLRDADACANMVQRLHSLQPDSKPQWGKMNVCQMLAHCQYPFKTAFGEMVSKRALIGILLGRFAKRKFIDSDAPFGKNSPTDPNFLDRNANGFEEQRQAVIDLLHRFQTSGASTKRPHPFFGALTANDWDRLMWKHLDHHLRQFGV